MRQGGFCDWVSTSYGHGPSVLMTHGIGLLGSVDRLAWANHTNCLVGKNSLN